MNINKALFTFIKIAFSVMVILLIVYGAVSLCRTGYDYGYRLYTEPPVAEAPGQDILVQIKDGMSAMDIAKMLEEKGLVRDSRLFYVQFMMSDYHKEVVAGVYTLNNSMDSKELMAAMVPEQESEGTEDTEDMEDTGSTEGTQDTGE